MAKTELTREIEEKLKSRAERNCERYGFEIPLVGGICDFVTTKINFSNHNIPHITCYEIKVSFNDYYYSENGANFVGDENYYVMPYELMEEIIQKKKNGKFYGVGIIVYKDGKFYKKTSGENNNSIHKKLSIEKRFLLLDTLLMRALKYNKDGEKDEI